MHTRWQITGSNYRWSNFNKIFPRYGSPLKLVTYNGAANVNIIMKETRINLNIKQITRSPYHPQNNSKVEHFHRFIGDILS